MPSSECVVTGFVLLVLLSAFILSFKRGNWSIDYLGDLKLKLVSCTIYYIVDLDHFLSQ